MDWYYAVGGERKGPIDEGEFQRLVQQGVITAQTLVWREGMANWLPYAGGTPGPTPGRAMADTVTCAGCGLSFPGSEVISLVGGFFCAACKPLALQRLSEGATVTAAAEELRNTHLNHEASVKSIGLLYYLGGAGMMLMALGTALSRARMSPGGVTLVFSAFFFLVGACQIWVGTGLRRLKKWARIPTGILSGLGLLAFPLGTIINAYILYLVFSQKGRMVFSDEYRAVIEQTPHIKYRTSVVVWILLGLVLFLILFGMVAAIFGRR